MNKINEHEESVQNRLGEIFASLYTISPTLSNLQKKEAELAEFLRSALSAHREVIRREVKKEKDELADALIDMYGQYCSDGHDFMSAGEGASTVLEMQGYASFDEAGRISLLDTPKETI